jgi:PAS domain S-box-containing protein
MTDSRSILVVDDESEALRLLTDTLVEEGYQVRSANSGQLALASAAAWRPQLILLDIRMPGIDGFEVCRRLKACEETRDIPLMFISAANDVEERVEGLALGAVDFVPKPFQREELLARVRTHLELGLLRAGLETQVSLRTMELGATIERLRESDERFRNMADTAPVMIWVSGPDKLCTFCNEYWLTFTGRTMEQEQGNGWAEGVHPEDLDRCFATYSDSFDARRPFRMEYRLRRADGEYRWLQDDGIPRFTPGDIFEGYIGSCVDVTEIKHANEELQTAYSEIKELKQRLEQENLYLQEEIKLEHAHHEVIGGSNAIRRVLKKAEQVASTDATVLLLGATGTGKELVARAIHESSRRKHRPMVKVNCAALPATLIESELFGREKGAFTGALTREMGRFELANGSTLFLDEIGELPLELQAKLLRVLQEGEFERLGSSKTIHVDVRIVAATARDLQAATKEGKFREDLYYRLNVFPIKIPPLRERREDIPALVWHFVNQLGSRMGRSIESIHGPTMEAFKNYDWPGNVRELRNAIERLLITTTDTVLRADWQPIETVTVAAASSGTLEEVERTHILHTLESTGWQIRGGPGAAAKLGLKPTTLESRMQKLGITRRK